MYSALLVDDEQRVAEHIRQLVAWENYGIRQVHVCGNGLEALEMMRKSLPDVVITDIKMPGMDGIELIQRSKRAGYDSEFIVMSGYKEFELAKSAMGQGVKYYLLKPCSEEEIDTSLASAMSDVQGRRAALNPVTVDQSAETTTRYDDNEVGREALALEAVVVGGDALKLQQVIEQLVVHRGRPFASLVFTQLLMKQMHRGVLAASAFTQLHNGLYEIKESPALAQYMMDSLAHMREEMPAEDNFIDRIVQYVDEHLEDPDLKLKRLAREVVFRHEDYVSRLFSQRMGESFHGYLTRKRLERAKYLIRHLGEDKIYSVAERVGLGHNPSYFSKLFKKHTGYTPKEYEHLQR